MTTVISGITFGRIKNVRKSGDENGVYFADIEISPQEGFPFDTHFYCARSDDYAVTGKWVYGEIEAGRYDGELTQLPPNVDPTTGQPFIERSTEQPRSRGAQDL